MRRILAVILSLALMLSICADGGIMLQADDSRTDVIDLYDSDVGATPNTSKDAWGYFVVGGNIWGQQDSCCNVDVQQLREYLRDGSYNLSFICTGTPSENDTVAVINGDFENGVKMSVAMLDDGKYEVTIPLKNVLNGYGKTADEVDGLCVQTWMNDFALYHISLFKLPEGASDTGTVYTSENGATPNTSKDAYGFFVVGGNVWGEDSCCGISAERMREYLRDGEYNLSFVFGGTPGDSAPLAVINGEFDTRVEMTVKELGDGRHEATIPLQSVLDGYGMTADDVDGLCVQTWVENFALYEIRLYKSEDEPEPEPEVELNVWWYPSSHNDTSTWEGAYYEGFTGDVYYDVFGKETAVVTDVSTKWDIADDNWQYLWLGIEDKKHNPGHNFTVKISGIVFHTDGNDVTYSDADGEHTFGGSGIIPVKVADVCGGQTTAEFLRALETVTVNLICTEHNGNKADIPDEPCTHPEESREWKSDAENHWQVCKICGEEVPETKKPHDKLTYDELDSDKHTVKCSTCGYSGEEEHSWDSGKTVEATETEKGYILYTCEKCKAEKKVETAHVHNGGEEWITDETAHWHKCTLAGCDYDGSIYGKASHTYVNGVCTVCGYEHKDHTPKAGSYKNVSAAEHSYVCAVCGATVTEAHTAGKQDHDADSHWTVCTECGAHIGEAEHSFDYVNDGVSGHHRKCSVCDYETETAPHSAAPADGKYTDSEDGETHTYLCAECGYSVSEKHQYSDWKYSDEDYHVAVCKCGAEKKEAHDYVYTEDTITETHHWTVCSVCNHETEPQDHHYEGNSDRCADCNYWNHQHKLEWRSNDTRHWQECTVAGCGFVTGKEEHSFGETTANETSHFSTCKKCGMTVTQEHKFDSYGFNSSVHWKVCSVCEYKTDYDVHILVDAADENGHWQECDICEYRTESEKHTPEKELGHNADGHWNICSECGELYNKTAHTPSDEPKHDAEGHWNVCSACGYESAEKEAHVWDDGKITVEPTYTKEGEKLYTCEVCGETKTETVPIKGHEHSTVTKSDENGHWEECTICGETVGEVEAHTPGEWITDSEATSTEAGKRHKECTVCGYVTDELTVPATGDIDVEVPTVGNVPKVELPAEQQEVLKNAVIDEEDVEAIESGASIDIELTVENAEGTIAPEDKAVSDEAAVQGNYTHVRYLDINLTKTVTDASGASTSEEISELGKEVKIVITVPLALAKPNGRDFAVIRVHDGEATVLKDLDSDPNTVTISTNLFSSYTLVYADTTPVPSTPGGLIGHVHVITGLQNDAHYHWRGCFICSMRVDVGRHVFVDGVCVTCGYHDPDYLPEAVSAYIPAEPAEQSE